MDKQPKPSDVPDELLTLIQEKKTWEWICSQWDKKYPDNPVKHREDEEKSDGDNPADAK